MHYSSSLYSLIRNPSRLGFPPILLGASLQLFERYNILSWISEVSNFKTFLSPSHCLGSTKGSRGTYK